jgi:hypothetical protein
MKYSALAMLLYIAPHFHAALDDELPLDEPPHVPLVAKIIAWIVLASVAILLWRTWRGRHDFWLIVRNGTVQFHGRFPANQRAAATEFLLKDVAPSSGTLRITGDWTGQRVLRVNVHGPLSEGDRQRIRNFLKLVLHG